MRVLLRCLLISLLILSLPLKGLAAVGYMPCGPAHAGAAVAQHQPVSGEHADHHRAHPPTDIEHESGKATSGSKCVQCAPCCGAVAPHTEAALPATDVRADTVLQEVGSLVVGGRTDRIDRPPRSLR